MNSWDTPKQASINDYAVKLVSQYKYNDPVIGIHDAYIASSSSCGSISPSLDANDTFWLQVFAPDGNGIQDGFYQFTAHTTSSQRVTAYVGDRGINRNINTDPIYKSPFLDYLPSYCGSNVNVYDNYGDYYAANLIGTAEIRKAAVVHDIIRYHVVDMFGVVNSYGVVLYDDDAGTEGNDVVY